MEKNVPFDEADRFILMAFLRYHDVPIKAWISFFNTRGVNISNKQIHNEWADLSKILNLENREKIKADHFVQIIIRYNLNEERLQSLELDLSPLERTQIKARSVRRHSQGKVRRLIAEDAVGTASGSCHFRLAGPGCPVQGRAEYKCSPKYPR